MAIISLRIAVLALGAYLVTRYIVMPLFFRQHVDYSGKHCYITGGSSGLGLALAEGLARKGADITIVARDVKKLEQAVERIKAQTTSPTQKIIQISADLSQFKPSAKAYRRSIVRQDGRVPDYVFLCAGASKPKHFVEMGSEDFTWTLNATYLPALHTSSVALRTMIKQGIKGGRIVFVSSFLGYTTFVGYTGYSAGKYAIRGLADSLRSEVLLYQKTHDLKIHLYTPAGILSPGYDEEEKTKPTVTKKIEEGDEPISPEKCVEVLLSGMDKGYYQITNDFITDLVRSQTRGAVPMNNTLWDIVLSILGFIGLPIWRIITDGTVRKHAAQHLKDVHINMDGLENDGDDDK